MSIIPSGIWRLSICVGFRLRRWACDETVEVLRDNCRLRGDRSALVSNAISLQHLVVDEYAARSVNCAGCLKHVRIRIHRIHGDFQTAIGGTIPCSYRSD
jgi:hypothetical protein